MWPVTTRRYRRDLDAAEATGYERRSAELVAERARTPRPRLYVDQLGSMNSDDHHFMLRNTGYAATDVSLTADESALVLRSPVFRRGPFGDSFPDSTTGHSFDADLTDAGRANGVTFQIEYTDQAGDPHAETYRLPPEKLFVNTQETRQEAYERGRADLQEEIDAQRARPIVEPQWLLGREPGGRYIISNSAIGSVAKDVKISANPAVFTFRGAPQWEDISVPADVEIADTIGTRIFDGFVGEHGRMMDVDVTVSWTDENGERWDLEGVPIKGTRSTW